MKNKLSQRLILLRKRNDLSQYTLAEKLGFSRGLISNYEQGRREPDYNTLLVFASFYNVSTDYLLGYSGDQHGSISEKDIELLQVIHSLSVESREDLEHYIDLLKIKDCVNYNHEKNI